MVEVPEITEINEVDVELLDFYVKNNPYFTYTPLPIQWKAILYCLRPPIVENNIIDLLFGGTRGSSKTTTAVMLCEMFLRDKDNRTAVVMKTLTQQATSGSVFSVLKNQLRDNKDIKIINSSPLSISNKTNNSTVEFYSASDVDQFKSRFSGKEYNLIINDESSFMDPEVFTFQYGSLRKPKHMKAPLKMIHLSNPSSNVEATNYLKDNYILGDKRMFINSSFKDNHYLDDNYEQTLQNLDYISQQYQLYGNFFYEVQAGDLLSSEEFDNYCASFEEYTPIDTLLSVDIAGSGDDLSVITKWHKTKENKWFIHSQYSSSKPNCDSLIIQVAKRTKPSLIIVEGGYQATYLVRAVKEKLYNSGLTCRVVEEPVHKNKYERAKLYVQMMLNGLVIMNKNMSTLQNLKGELLSIVPNFKGRSPNFLDSVSIFCQYASKHLNRSGGMKMVNLQNGTSIGFDIPEAPNPSDYDFNYTYHRVKFENKCRAVAKANKQAFKQAWREGKIRL